MTKRMIEYWVIPPDANAEFVANMEEVLETYEKAYDPNGTDLSPKLLLPSELGLCPVAWSTMDRAWAAACGLGARTGPGGRPPGDWRWPPT